MERLPSYVLITPARNEAEFIERTLRSVAAQTTKPVRWVIVSQGSSDGTDGIVTRYVAEHPWIELLRMPEARERSFSGKALAFNAGYARVRDLRYDVIGSLDADISFDEEYFSFLLGKLAADPSLGVVGTPFREHVAPVYDYRFVNIEHVSGACQVFRRTCFEEIGGFTPVKVGGVDDIAVTTARMKGWATRTFTEKVCTHHRQDGHGRAQRPFRPLPNGRQGLRSGKSPALGDVQSSAPDELKDHSSPARWRWPAAMCGLGCAASRGRYRGSCCDSRGKSR